MPHLHLTEVAHEHDLPSLTSQWNPSLMNRQPTTESRQHFHRAPLRLGGGA
jgi:hypothetical protein